MVVPSRVNWHRLSMRLQTTRSSLLARAHRDFPAMTRGILRLRVAQLLVLPLGGIQAAVPVLRFEILPTSNSLQFKAARDSSSGNKQRANVNTSRFFK